ncbi:MAG: FAD-binding oxidoreductase [Myxococcota bacterium]
MDGSPFETIVGVDACVELEGQTLDGVPITHAVRPADASQLAACLAAARETHRPLIVSGTGSKLGWGNRSRAAELVRIELTRLDRPLELDVAEGVVRVGAGVRLEMLEQCAAEQGQRTRLPVSSRAASVGGTLATDPPSPELGPASRLRDDVLGLRVAHPTGELSRCGGRVVKNVTGFDLVRLYCGSFGTLGVITEATLRLRPLPEQRLDFCRSFACVEDALERSEDLVHRDVSAAVLSPVDGGALLRWRLEGCEADVQRRERALEGDREMAPALEDAARALWATTAAHEDRVRVRLGALSSELSLLCRELTECAGPSALRIVLPLAGLLVAEVPEPVLPTLYRVVEARSWWLLVERASPECKRALDVFGPPPPALSLMRALKRKFDPADVLSPGRFVSGI